jgi:hypothetical protein
VGRVQTLTAARGPLAPRPADEDYAGHATLDPRLLLIYQPSRCQAPPPTDGARLLLESIRRVWPVLREQVGGAGALGAHPPAGGLPLQLVGTPSSGWPICRPWGLPLQQVTGAGALGAHPPAGGLPLQLVGTPSSSWPSCWPWGLPLQQVAGAGALGAHPPAGGLPLQLVAGAGGLPALWCGLRLLGAPAGAPGLLGAGHPAPWACQTREVRKTAPRRHGLAGLTSNGARQIQRACAVLQDCRPCLAFWTVTLPDTTIRELIGADLWPKFQTRLRDLLVRALKRRGLPARVVGVVELHPGRSMRERLPLPHLHVVFQGRGGRGQPWALDRAALDRLIVDAVRYVGLPAPDVRAAGNVQPVRRNCGAYLAKYCTKNREAAWLKQVPGNLPRVWWFWSAPLRSEVLALVLPVCWSFVSWLHRLPLLELERLGVARVRLDLPDPRAPVTWCCRFRSCDALRRAQFLWGGWERSLQLACVADS